MQAKALRLPGRALDVLTSLPEPPSAAAIEAAVSTLVRLGALTPAEETLTPLGRLLVELPLEPRLAKLLLLGVCFGAADEALTIAAFLAGRSPFLVPTDPMEARFMDASKLEFADGSQSDHLAALNAYRAYFELPLGLGDPRGELAARRFLCVRTLEEMRSLKRQLLEQLADARLLSRLPY